MSSVSSGRPSDAPSPPLGIDIQRDGRTTILRLTGELDLATADELRRHVLLALDRHDPDRLLLDLSELSFTDSSGLAAMVWAHHLLADRGRQLRLQHPQPLVRRVLHVTGLHTRLHITDTPPRPGGVPRGRPPRRAARPLNGHARRDLPGRAG